MTFRTCSPMLTAFSSIISVMLFFVNIVAAQDSDSGDSNAKPWISHPEPGITLIGKANTSIQRELGYQIAISPDGKYVAGLRMNKDLVVLDRESKEIIREVPIDIRNVTKALFSSDGSKLAVVGYDYLATRNDKDNIISQTYTGRCVILDDDFRILHEIDFDPMVVTSNQTIAINIPIGFCFSPDASQAIVSGQTKIHWINVDSGEVVDTQPTSSDANISFTSNDSAYLWRSKKLWNRDDRELISESTIGKFKIPSTVYYFMPHPSDPIIAYYDQSKSLFSVANWKKGKLLHQIPIKDYIVNSGKFSASKNLFTALCYTKDFKSAAIAIFDLEAEQVVHMVKIDRNQSVDTKLVDDETLLLFQPQKGISELKLDEDFEVNADRELKSLSESRTLEVNHDGTASLVDYARAYVNLDTGDIGAIYGNYSPSFTFAKKNNLALLGLHQGEIKLTDLESNQTKKTYKLPAEAGVVKGILKLLGRQKKPQIYRPPYPTEIRASNDGKSTSAIFIQVKDQGVEYGYCSWDSKSGRQSSSILLPKDLGNEKHSNRLVACISPSCQRLAYITKSQVHVVDSETLKPEIEFDLENAELMEFSHDEKYLAIGFNSEKFRSVDNIEVYDLETGDLVKEFDRPNQTFTFAADAGKFAICDGPNGHHVEVYDTDDWDNPRTFETDYATRNAIAFSGDGKRLVSCLSDTRIEVWDLDEMEE